MMMMYVRPPAEVGQQAVCEDDNKRNNNIYTYNKNYINVKWRTKIVASSVAPLRGAAATTSTVRWPKQANKWYRFYTFYQKNAAKSQGKFAVPAIKAIKIELIMR